MNKTRQFSEKNENMMRQESKERLKNRIKKSRGDIPTTFQELGHNDIKMSEIIVDLADFLLERATNEAKQRAALSITCAAWNIAVLGMQKAKKNLDSYFQNLNDPIHQSDTLDILNILIQKKKERYAHINRIIMDFEMICIKKRIHLNVVSMELEDKNSALELSLVADE